MARVTTSGVRQRMARRFGSLSLATRAAAAATLALVVILGAGSFVMRGRASDALEVQGLATVADKVGLARALVESKAQSLRVETERLGDMFAAGLGDGFSVNVAGEGFRCC